MRNFIIRIVIFLLTVFCFIRYEVYGDHCNTEQPKEGQQENTGPSTPPKTLSDETPKEDKFKDTIPKITPYGDVQSGPYINEDGSVGLPPKSGPMVSDKVMDGIRKTPRNQVIVGDPITVQQSQEDCCNRADAELLRCYGVESNAVFRQCVEERSIGDGYVNALSGWSDAVDMVCEKKEAEFQTQCLEKFFGKCNRGCKIPQSIKTTIRREIIELQYGPGSTGGGGGNTRYDPKAVTDHMPH